MITELLPAFVAGAIGSIVVALVFLFLRRQMELRLSLKELEFQRRILMRQQSEIERRARDSQDNPQIETDDRLLLRAASALDSGVYEATIVIAAAAVENRLRGLLQGEGRLMPFPQLIRRALEEGVLEEDGATELRKIWELRNRSVHGHDTHVVSRDEAATYLRKSDEILRVLSTKFMRPKKN